jgi:hypothetical protein
MVDLVRCLRAGADLARLAIESAFSPNEHVWTYVAHLRHMYVLGVAAQRRY